MEERTILIVALVSAMFLPRLADLMVAAEFWIRRKWGARRRRCSEAIWRLDEDDSAKRFADLMQSHAPAWRAEAK